MRGGSRHRARRRRSEWSGHRSRQFSPEGLPVATATNVSAPEGVRRLSVAHFLLAEVVLLVTVPFVDQLHDGDLIESALFTLVLLMAVMAVGGRRKTLVTAAVLVT